MGTSPTSDETAEADDRGTGYESDGIVPSLDRLRGYWYMFRAVVYFEFLLLVRYPMNFVGQVVMFLLIFVIIFFGGRAVAGQALENSLAGLLVGYYLWIMATVSYNGLANGIKVHASWGTLERHFITPYGFGPVVMAMSVAKLIRTFVVSTGILLVLMVITGATVTVDLVTIGVLLIPTLASAMGVGIAIGGLTVLYKRIDNWTNLVQFAFIGLISAPALDLGWMQVLPLAQGSALLQRAMRDGTHVLAFDPAELAVLVAVAVGWFCAGYLVFSFTQRRARQLGALGDY